MPKKILGQIVYTAKEAAEELQLDKQTILRWCRQKTSFGTKVGREYVIRKEKMDQIREAIRTGGSIEIEQEVENTI